MSSLRTREYQRLLLDLHREITDENVKALKFLTQPVINKRLFEQIGDGRKFFSALQDCNLLTSEDISFLAALLESIRRLDLQTKCDDFIQKTDAVGEDRMVCPFRKLLLQLHREIEDEDLNRMRFLCDFVPKRARIEDPLDLFVIMMQECCLGPDNLTFLKDILREVMRLDLHGKVEHFERTVDIRDCGYSQLLYQTPPAGPVFQEAEEESGMYTNIPGKLEASPTELENRMASTSLESQGPVQQEQYPQGIHQNGHAHPDCYKMDAKPRGICLIIDIDKFTYDEKDRQAVKQTDRRGSSYDRANLKSTFEMLHFEVRIQENPRQDEVVSQLKQLSQEPMWSFDCLVVCVLSHGALNYFFSSEGRKVPERIFPDLFNARNCPSLAGKPKLFFFSFCRGRDHQPAVPVQARPAPSIEQDGPHVDSLSDQVPEEADMFFGYATIPNNVAYRSTKRGTTYIEALTDVLKNYAHCEEFQHLMLRVSREVATRTYFTANGCSNKQLPAPNPRLLKKLYFL